MFPEATNVTGTIKIGTTKGEDDFGSATLTSYDFDDADGHGTILRDAALGVEDVCTTSFSTITLYFTVTVTSGNPVTFLFEMVSAGYYNSLPV
jgi:hypothetical protein